MQERPCPGPGFQRSEPKPSRSGWESLATSTPSRGIVGSAAVQQGRGIVSSIAAVREGGTGAHAVHRVQAAAATQSQDSYLLHPTMPSSAQNTHSVSLVDVGLALQQHPYHVPSIHGSSKVEGGPPALSKRPVSQEEVEVKRGAFRNRALGAFEPGLQRPSDVSQVVRIRKDTWPAPLGGSGLGRDSSVRDACPEQTCLQGRR